MSIEPKHILKPKHSYHRNGIAGIGFFVVLFDWKDNDGVRRHMMAILHDTGSVDSSGYCAVLDVDETKRGNIVFAGGNSWRGDDFEPALKAVIRESNPDVFT